VLLADRLHQAMAQAQRRETLLAVAYLDLDGFKAINDQHGHETGDQLLIALASRMKDALREGDTLARPGGDEFVVVLLDLADVAASLRCQPAADARRPQPVQIGDLVLKVSASLGVTFYPQATRSTPTSCCARPTRPCTRPSSPARTATTCSMPTRTQRARPNESLEHIRRALDESGVRAALPAQGEHAHRHGHRRRSADPLAASGSGCCRRGLPAVIEDHPLASSSASG
jgi:diguanylate cyclase (GGDEF)-like protein